MRLSSRVVLGGILLFVVAAPAALLMSGKPEAQGPAAGPAFETALLDQEARRVLQLAPPSPVAPPAEFAPLGRAIQPHYLQEQRVASNQSIALIETLKIMMKVSHNLYAEILLRKLGAESVGFGSIGSGVTAVKTFLEKTGTSKEDLHLSDGSGMSRTDMITPESIVRLLQYMQKHPQGPLFLATLPIGGIDGTLEHRMQKTPAASRIHAKTGTSKFVATLSGYVQPKSGEMLAFSIMANNHSASTQEVRDVIDQICTLMAEYVPRKKARHRN